MSKKWIWLVGLVCCTAVAGLVLAEGRGEDYGIEWDAEAVQGMSKAERLAYQQAYKGKLEAAARQNGWVPSEERGFKRSGRRSQLPNKAAGSITYHSGTLGTCCLNSNMIGNQFDFALNPGGTAISPVMMSGSITMATFDMIAASGGVFLSAYHLRAGTAAPRITSFSTPGVSGANTKTVTIGYSGSSFLAGIWNFTLGGDSPAVATGTVSGQGFHGVSLADGASAASIVDLSALNAAFTVGGNVLTPVELLNFEVE